MSNIISQFYVCKIKNCAIMFNVEGNFTTWMINQNIFGSQMIGISLVLYTNGIEDWVEYH
jgi:hypothetical protein